MIRIAALNDSSSECDGGDVRAKAVGTREAEESEAYTLYNKALGLQRQDIQKAEEAFEQLLSHGFIREAAKLVETETVGIIHPGLQLLYSIYKNLAAMSLQKGDHEEAMEWYIEAVKVDESETTVWYKIGTIALKLHNYQLARLGFEQGLQCNPNHWPCLDNIVTVLYTINDYWYCLYYISKALKKDYLYPKGIVFRNQIFKEQPSLKEATKEMFNECNPLIDKENVDQEEMDEFINEALAMRQKRRELAKTPPMKPNKLPVPIKSYTWLSLGESLIALYDTIKKSNPPMSMGIRVDLSDYAVDKDKNTDAQNEEKQNLTASSMSSTEVPPVEDKAGVSKAEEMEVDLTPATEPATDVIPVSVVSTVGTDTMSDTATSVTNTSTSDTAVGTVVSSSDSVVTVSGNETTAASETVISVSSVTVISEREIFTSISPVTSGPSTPDVSTSFALLSSIPISVTSVLQDLPSSETSDTEGKIKGQKRKRTSNFENPYYEKRRSARVRNTFTRREEERVNFREILETFIPSSLRSGVDEEEMESLDLVSEKEESVFSKPNKTDDGKGLDAKLLSATEGADVRDFLVREQKNGGMLMLMLHFLEALCDRSELVWPQELTSVYVRVYIRRRRHTDLPCLLSNDEPAEDIRSFGKMVLLKLEFQFDQWLTKHLKSGASPKGKSPKSALPSDMPKFWEEDMDYIFGLQGQSEVLGSLWLQHCVRAYWLQARLCLLQGEIQYASCSFHKAKEFLRWRIEDENVSEMHLQNCQSDNWISLESIERHQDSLERSQSMDEMQKLYEAKEFDKVVELLLKAVTQPTQKPMRKNSDSVIPTRIEQLCLLNDCLFKMGDVQRSMQWGEIAFHETFLGYKKATTSPQKEEWSAVLNQIWTSFLKNLEKPESLRELTVPRKIRLTSDLMSVIDIMMSVPEKATDMPIGSVLPWMILYSVISFEEEKEEQESQAPSTNDSLPSSLMLLSVSHEYLGSHSWCTKSNGKFLIFFLEILQKKMRDSCKYTDDLRQMYEQCVYCLYGHPNKKGKARHLQDHNVPPISLTLNQAIQLFEYFKPKNLPEFDSFKTDTVSAEVETLLRRIVQFIPEKEKPANRLDKVQDFIDGISSVAPSTAEGIEFLPITQEVYYLLADYYFKNNEHPKAIKFYMHDICVCPQRLDSWAGLALARMSQLEQKLNSTDLKLDVSLQKRSRAALRCFERAVDIEDAYGKLWMEYGSLSYQLHAHSSKQLNFNQEKKLECDEDFLQPDLQQLASSFKVEMLELAYMCYKSASQCVDEESEEWLTDYMMGKCLEKMHKSPKEYLDYYRQAAFALHEENATYPKKITYAYTAHTSPRLAVEALEMFYRLHVSILKLLMKGSHSEEYHLFADYIDEAANSPFAKGCEKKDEESGNVSMDYDDTKQDKTTTNQQDHTYSKLKESTNMMENVDKSKVSVDSADSMDEKNEDSANNSMDSSEYFPSAEPSESSQDVAGAMETEDSMQIFSTNPFRHHESCQLPQTMELSAEELDSGDKVPNLEESASKDLDNRDPLSKQKSLGFVPSEMVDESKSHSTCNLNVMNASEVVKNNMDVIEIFSSPEPVDPSVRPKFFLPNDQPNVVSEKSVMEIVTSCSVQSAENKDSVMSGEKAAGAVLDTKTLGDIQTRDSRKDPEEKIGSVKHTEDKSLAVVEGNENEEKPSGGLMEEETLKASAEILSSLSDKTSVVEESPKTTCVEIESPFTRPDQGQTQSGGPCRDVGVKIETSNVELLHKGGGDHAEKQVSTKDESSKPVEKETKSVGQVATKVESNKSVEKEMKSVQQLTTKVEPSKPVEKETKSVEQLPTKVESSKPVEKETKSVQQLTTKDDSIKPAEKETKSVDQLTKKEESSKPVEKETKSVEKETKSVEKETKSVEQVTTKDESSKSVEKETKPRLEGTALRKDLIEKCMAALHLCLSRFPTHYKSTYRLAYVYFYSPYHKNLQYARDLLLGNPQWQTLSYMPAQGLFSERKVNNFFQGTWRLPISEVERAGSFATHLNRAVLLLLKVLLEQTDVLMLYHLHLQFNRTPDAEKRYLRDSERLHYSRLALDYCLCAVKNRLPEIRELQDSQKSIQLLMETYKVYNYGISKQKTTAGPRISNLLAATYKAVMKEEVSTDKPLLEQAIKMCQLYQQQNTIQRQGTVRTNVDTSQSDSSIFSPDRALSNPFRSSGTPQSPIKMFHNNTSPIPQIKSQQSLITSLQIPTSKVQTPQSPVRMSTSSTPRPQQQVPTNKPQAPQSPVKMSTSLAPRPQQQVPPNKPHAPLSLVKMSTSLAPRPQQQVPPNKPQAPQSPVKMSTSLAPRPQQQVPPNKPQASQSPVKMSTSLAPRPQQPVIQLTKLQMHVAPQNLPELTKKTPPKEEPRGTASKSEQSRSSDNLSISPKPSTSGISAISLISSLIEDGISKANKQKMEKERTESASDEPPGPVKTPPTPRIYKASSPGPTAGAKRPALQLHHPKKKALLLEDVIEIISSDEGEDMEEAVKLSTNSKPSFSKGLETNQQLFTKDSEEMVEKRTGQEQKMEINVKTSSATLKTDIDESEDLNDPNSSMVCGEGDSKIEADKESGPGKDEMSEKELPYLDPSTGLFVTDSDSQNSVYVANPENISFEDELMVEDC